MERLVRLNEMQYAATEAQAERLKEQGFRVEALLEDVPVKDAEDGNKNTSDGDKKGGK